MFQVMLTSPLISFKFKLACLYLPLFWTCLRLVYGSDHICDLVTTGERLKLQGILHWDNSLLIVVDNQVYDLDLTNEQRGKELARDHTLMMYELGGNEPQAEPCVPDCPQPNCIPCQPTPEPEQPETSEQPETPEQTTPSYDSSEVPNTPENVEPSARRRFAGRHFAGRHFALRHAAHFRKAIRNSGNVPKSADCEEVCTPAPCANTCPQQENTPSFSLIQPVAWTEHKQTRTADENFHSNSLNRISLFHIRKCDHCGQLETRYYVHYYFTDLRVYLVRQDHTEEWKDPEKEYRFFSTVTNGKSKGYLFYYSDYIHFDQESITEDIDHIIAHRRVVVGPMIDCCREQVENGTLSWLPFATPETTEHIKLKPGPNMLVMKVLDSNRQVFNLLPYSDKEEVANAEDLFRTVPFGFIYEDLAYLFTIANQEVVVVKAGDCEEGHATVTIIDKVAWRSFFKCSPGQTRSVMDRDAKKYSQSEYDALARSMRDGLPNVDGLSIGAMIGLAGGTVLLILGLIATMLCLSKRKGSKGSKGTHAKKTGKEGTTKSKTKTSKSTSAKTTTDKSSTATTSKASDSASKKRPSASNSEKPKTKKKPSTKKEPSGKQEASGPKKPHKKKPSKKKPSKKKPSKKK